jgi:hypothetical protein
MFKGLLIKIAYAEPGISNAPIEGTIFGDMTLGGLFIMAVNLLIMIGFGLVLVFLALGFIKFITSQGDKVATEQAQKWITYTIIGGIGLFAVYAIKELILTLIGAEDPLLE